MDPRTHAAVTWLLNCDEPAIRLMTRRDVLGEQADEDAGQVLAGAKVTALLPRVAGPGLGTARVRAGHRRSGRQGRGQPHRRAVPGPPDRQVS
jgi:hypothetical protein